MAVIFSIRSLNLFSVAISAPIARQLQLTAELLPTPKYSALSGKVRSQHRRNYTSSTLRGRSSWSGHRRGREEQERTCLLSL